MKILSFVCLLALSAACWAANPADNDAASLTPELQAKIREIGVAFSTGKYADALAKMDEADKIQPNSALLCNLRGAIYVKQREFPKAIEQFNKALQLKSDFFDARFNLCEIQFLEKKYAEARKSFQKLKEDSSIKSEPNQQKLWRDVVDYKIYLTYLLEGNEGEGQKILQKIDPYVDSPLYYFSKAAWDYQHKEKTKAESWIASSLNIFSPQVNDLFADSLVEVGWIPKTPAPAAAAAQEP